MVVQNIRKMGSQKDLSKPGYSGIFLRKVSALEFRIEENKKNTCFKIIILVM